jgi:hypothetical protein
VSLVVAMVALHTLEQLLLTLPKQAWQIQEVVVAVRVMHKRVLLAALA